MSSDNNSSNPNPTQRTGKQADQRQSDQLNEEHSAEFMAILESPLSGHPLDDQRIHSITSSDNNPADPDPEPPARTEKKENQSPLGPPSEEESKSFHDLSPEDREIWHLILDLFKKEVGPTHWKYIDAQQDLADFMLRIPPPPFSLSDLCPEEREFVSKYLAESDLEPTHPMYHFAERALVDAIIHRRTGSRNPPTEQVASQQGPSPPRFRLSDLSPEELEFRSKALTELNYERALEDVIIHQLTGSRKQPTEQVASQQGSSPRRFRLSDLTPPKLALWITLWKAFGLPKTFPWKDFAIQSLVDIVISRRTGPLNPPTGQAASQQD